MFVPRNFRNILMKSVSFYLERFQRYGVLKNVQLFAATSPKYLAELCVPAADVAGRR